MAPINAGSLTGNVMYDALMVAMYDDDNDFIAMQVSPTQESDTKEFSIDIIGNDDKILDNNDRGDRQEASETIKLGQWEIKFNCKSYDEKVHVTPSMRDRNRNREDLLYAVLIQQLARKIKLKMEQDFMLLATTAANYGSYTDTPAAAEKFDYSSGTSYPISYLNEQAQQFKIDTGLRADSVIFTASSLRTFVSNSTVSGKLPIQKYGVVTVSDILPLLNTPDLQSIQNVYIANAIHDSDVRGTEAERTGAELYSDDVVLFKKSKKLANGLVSAGGFVAGMCTHKDHFMTKEYEEDKFKGKFLESRVAIDFKLIKNYNDSLPYARLIKGTNE